MAIHSACARLLADAQVFAPLYGNGLSNHLPMGLIALDRMGAAADDLQRFFEHQAPKLELLASSNMATRPSPGEALQSAFALPAYLNYFSHSIRAVGADALLRDWLPRLMPGVGASAFHALIRLAYALDAENDVEICHALALWAAEFLAFDLAAQTTDQPLAQIACELRQRAMPAPAQGIIADKMRHIASQAVVRDAILQPASISLADIAQFSRNAFVENDDFTLLHLLTASHAMRLVLPYCGDQEAALRYFWRASLMAYLTVDHAKHSVMGGAANANWADAFAAAIRCDDEHTIKLIYTAFCENNFYGDAGHVHIMRRRLQQLAPAIGDV